MSPPWAPIPGTRKPRPGATARMAGNSVGAVAPTTSPTVPPGPHPRRMTGDAQVEGFGRGGRSGSVGGDDQVLELRGLGIGGATQDVRVAVRAFVQRSDRLATRVRIDGHRVGAEPVEQGDCMTRRGRPDVGPFRVDDDRDVRRDRGADPFKGGQSVRSERLVESQIRFDGRCERPSGLDDEPDEPLDAGELAGKPSGNLPGPDPGPGTGHCRPTPIARRVARGRGRVLRGRARPGVEAALEAALGGAAAGSWLAGTNQPGRDSPSRPETSVRAMTSLTVQSGARPPRRRSWRSTRAADVQERDRVAGRRPDRCPRRAVVGQALELARRSRVEDDQVVAEAALLGRDDEAPVRGVRRLQVSAAGPVPTSSWPHPSGR